MKILRNNFINIFIVLLGITLVAIFGFIYYQANLYTPADYETNLTADRSGIIDGVDNITQLLNSETTETDIEAEITKLEKNNANFKTKVDQLKTPKDHEDLKTANLEFSQSITNYCTNARAYLGIIKDDRVIDIEKVIVNFNSSVEEINAKTKQINEKLGA